MLSQPRPLREPEVVAHKDACRNETCCCCCSQHFGVVDSDVHRGALHRRVPPDSRANVVHRIAGQARHRGRLLDLLHDHFVDAVRVGRAGEHRPRDQHHQGQNNAEQFGRRRNLPDLLLLVHQHLFRKYLIQMLL